LPEQRGCGKIGPAKLPITADHSVSEGAIDACAADASHYGRFRWHEIA
jgi:hypothetical protein